MIYNKRVILLEKCPNGKITKENWCTYLLSDVEIKIDKDNKPNKIIIFKDNKGVFQHDYKNKIFWEDNKVWSCFISNINPKNLEINIIIKDDLEVKMLTLNCVVNG